MHTTTLEIVAGPTTTNSSICEIGIQRTTTGYCSNHWFIVFRHHNGGNVSAEVNKKLYAVEWACNTVLHCSNFAMKFNVTDKCLGIQDLATSISILEGHSYPEMTTNCSCSHWVSSVIRKYQEKEYLPRYDCHLSHLIQNMRAPDREGKGVQEGLLEPGDVEWNGDVAF